MDAAKTKYLLLFAALILVCFAGYGCSSEKAYENYYYQTIEFIDTQQYQKAEESALKGIEKAKVSFGDQSAEYAMMLSVLAENYHRWGKMKKAVETYEQEITLHEQYLGTDTFEAGNAYGELGYVYEELGNFKAAEDALKKSVDSFEKMGGADKRHLIQALEQLALLYHDQLLLKESIAAFQRLIQFVEETNPAYANLAAMYYLLATSVENSGKPQEATELYQKALDLRASNLGDEHPHTLTAMKDLAGNYAGLNRFKEARDILQKVYDIQKETQGPENLKTLETLRDLSAMQDRSGDLENAIKSLKEVISVSEKSLGEEHPSVIADVVELAYVYEARGEYNNAVPLLKRELAAKEKRLGPDHPDIAVSHIDIARNYAQQGKLKEAKDFFEKALAVRKAALGATHPDVIFIEQEIKKLSAVRVLVQRKAATPPVPSES